MAESRESIPLTVARAERIFPTLTEAQMQRLASHGAARSVRSGEVLVELGDKEIPVFWLYLVNSKSYGLHLLLRRL